MPAYSFLCQTSHLASMARQGFDFNTCIYEGEVLFYPVFSFFFMFLWGGFKILVPITMNLDMGLLFSFVGVI